jgi:hypothetical protein
VTAAQRKIERSFQRAMDIRDSSPWTTTRMVENRYAALYRRAYRSPNARTVVHAFRRATREYLKALRGVQP